jgi:polyferredoxin
MMGSFAGLMIWVIPTLDVYKIGFTILVFMESATALAVLAGILFTPRAWCTFCPMGFTTERIRGLRRKKKP